MCEPGVTNYTYHDDSELSQTLSDAINSVVDSPRKIWRDGWLGTEKLEGMVDSARKNLKGWLTRHGKFVLTRHGKTWRDGWLGTENLKGWLTRHGKFVLTRHGKTWRDVSDVCLLVTFSSVKWLTRYGKTIGVKDKKGLFLNIYTKSTNQKREFNCRYLVDVYNTPCDVFRQGGAVQALPFFQAVMCTV